MLDLSQKQQSMDDKDITSPEKLNWTNTSSVMEEGRSPPKASDTDDMNLDLATNF
jgi:hypothetical protein